ARRYVDVQIVPAAAVAVVTSAGPPGLRPPVLSVHDPGQVVGAGHGPNDHVAPVAAITTVGPAARHVLLAPEAAAAGAAVASLDVQADAIDKHCGSAVEGRAGLMLSP